MVCTENSPREADVTNSPRIPAVNPVIPAKRMQESLAFHQAELGFNKVFDDAAEPGMPIGYAAVMRGGVCLHLQAVVPGQDEAMPLLRIAVQNIDSLYAQYDRKGVVNPGARLETKPWGSRDFGVYDPNGAALVFYEDL